MVPPVSTCWPGCAANAARPAEHVMPPRRDGMAADHAAPHGALCMPAAVRHLLRALDAAPVQPRRRATGVPQRPRTGPPRRRARLRVGLGGRAPLPRGVLALLGSGGRAG